jgi:hypothetical protein
VVLCAYGSLGLGAPLLFAHAARDIVKVAALINVSLLTVLNYLIQKLSEILN